mmetsp:Transcript_51968/g.103169  ORF Transcript_51968/g.103169 Transcript_51968/m.103169 type:complete len:210 (-) Transcript_51968:2116-2745(-)
MPHIASQPRQFSPSQKILKVSSLWLWSFPCFSSGAALRSLCLGPLVSFVGGARLSLRQWEGDFHAHVHEAVPHHVKRVLVAHHVHQVPPAPAPAHHQKLVAVQQPPATLTASLTASTATSKTTVTSSGASGTSVDVADGEKGSGGERVDGSNGGGVHGVGEDCAAVSSVAVHQQGHVLCREGDLSLGAHEGLNHVRGLLYDPVLAVAAH